MGKRNLHKRIALNIIRLAGTDIRYVLLGFMISTALESMRKSSSTATTMMMFPIALDVAKQFIDFFNFENREQGLIEEKKSGNATFLRPGLSVTSI
jgi:sodium-dependent dicarboxylate transporter 2/3/5